MRKHLETAINVLWRIGNILVYCYASTIRGCSPTRSIGIGQNSCHSFSTYANFSNKLKGISFSENFAYVLNEWSYTNSGFIVFKIFRRIAYYQEIKRGTTKNNIKRKIEI